MLLKLEVLESVISYSLQTPDTLALELHYSSSEQEMPPWLDVLQ